MSIIFSDLDIKMKLNNDGSVNLVIDDDSISQSIKTILSTRPGERYMLPEFGSRLPYILFEPMDEFTSNLIEDEINRVLERWENRITIINTEVTPDFNKNLYELYVFYVFKMTGIKGEFVGKVKAAE